MNLYEYIKADHKKVSDLFSLFEKTEASHIKLQIVALIIKELIAHLESEEKTFYHALEKFPESREAAKHGEKEHAEIEEIIKQLMQQTDPNLSWEESVSKLKELVEHHVKEEGNVHSKAKEMLSKEQAFVIKEQMHYLKTDILQNMEF